MTIGAVEGFAEVVCGRSAVVMVWASVWIWVVR
jgi:hypothetical protein